VLFLLPLTATFRCQEQAILKGIHMIDSYLNSTLDFLGGRDRLSFSILWMLNPPLCLPLFGVHCCSQPGGCHEACSKHKNDCDEFQCCPSKICRDACETTLELLLDNVSLHLGCKLYWTANEPHVGVTRKKKMIFKEDADRWSQQMRTEEHNL
ncbi:hypothetical protein FD755_020410, partial [Muntiacus reevesi]